jgi:hypothetical protein
MVPFGGLVLSGGSRRLCSLACVSDALGMKHLLAQFGVTLMLHVWVRTDLSI